jgi:hypothetical protein
LVQTLATLPLEDRFLLRKTRYISERFEKSPNLTERCLISDHLHIRHAACDAQVLPFVGKSLLLAYGYVRSWFDCGREWALDLWMAPSPADLQYMTCLPCDAGFACCPGSRNGRGIILFASPLACGRNADRERLDGLLAHEITHHVIGDLSGATVLSMKRKQRRDVPMWLEEGLCQVIQSELSPSLQKRLTEKIARTGAWYEPEELWDDLSFCEDVGRAYLQAYRETKALLGARSKTDVIDLLKLNRVGGVNWSDVHRDLQSDVM